MTKHKFFQIPTICFSCGKVFKVNLTNRHYFCEKCLSQIYPLSTFSYNCKFCSTPLYGDKNDYCEQCSKTFYSIDILKCLYPYKNIYLYFLVQELKFHHFPQAGKDIYHIIKKEFLKVLKELSFDLVTFVPSSQNSLLERGYNPVLKILEESNLVLTPLLKRSQDSRFQHLLGRKERIKTIKDQYLYNSQKNIKGKTILIIDDIFTTGATLDICSILLKEKGKAKKVLALTFFRA